LSIIPFLLFLFFISSFLFNKLGTLLLDYCLVLQSAIIPFVILFSLITSPPFRRPSASSCAHFSRVSPVFRGFIPNDFIPNGIYRLPMVEICLHIPLTWFRRPQLKATQDTDDPTPISPIYTQPVATDQRTNHVTLPFHDESRACTYHSPICTQK